MKLPKNAKLVFKGQIFEVYQWEQKNYDGSISIFEGLKRPGTIQIIPSRGEQIFLSFEEQPTKPLSYTFLGGRQEDGEDPEVTAKRELLEEAGLSSDDWELLKIYESEGKIDWNIYLYLARNCQKVAQPKLDPGEKIEVKAVSFENFLKIIDSEKFWGKTIANDIHKLTHSPQLLQEFKERLFKAKI